MFDRVCAVLLLFVCSAWSADKKAAARLRPPSSGRPRSGCARSPPKSGGGGRRAPQARPLPVAWSDHRRRTARPPPAPAHDDQPVKGPNHRRQEHDYHHRRTRVRPPVTRRQECNRWPRRQERGQLPLPARVAAAPRSVKGRRQARSRKPGRREPRPANRRRRVRALARNRLPAAASAARATLS